MATDIKPKADEAKAAEAKPVDAKKADDDRKARQAERAEARQAEHKAAREEIRENALKVIDERLDRADALASVPQKVIDPNEAAALETITGQKPVRDLSEAPEPGQLGPHSESLNPVADPADVNTSVSGPEEAPGK